MHILLVEDDLDLGPALLAALKAEGMSAQWVRRAADARAALGPEVDLVLLDRALGGQEGLDLLRHWRMKRITTPVIVITARSALTDRLEGLDEGADDYLVKPFEIPELLSRVRAVHRRHRQQASELWELGELTVSPRSHQAWLKGELLALSAREFQLLLLALAKDSSTVVPKQVLGQLLEPLGDTGGCGHRRGAPVQPAPQDRRRAHPHRARRGLPAQTMRRPASLQGRLLRVLLLAVVLVAAVLVGLDYLAFRSGISDRVAQRSAAEALGEALADVDEPVAAAIVRATELQFNRYAT